MPEAETKFLDVGKTTRVLVIPNGSSSNQLCFEKLDIQVITQEGWVCVVEVLARQPNGEIQGRVLGQFYQPAAVQLYWEDSKE